MNKSDVEDRVEEINETLGQLLGVAPEDPDRLDKVEKRAKQVSTLANERRRLQGWLNVQDREESGGA